MTSDEVFVSQLQRDLNQMDPAWRPSFVDFELLRKGVKKIVYFELQEKGLNPFSSLSPPSAALTPSHHTSPRPSPHLQAIHINFTQQVKLQIDRLNSFFLARESACLKIFDDLALDHPSVLQEQVHPIATLTFAKVITDTFPANAPAIISSDLLYSCGSIPMDELGETQVALFRNFLHLAYELDQLRKYLCLNGLILWKIIKKYERHAMRRDSCIAFMHSLETEPFASQKTGRLIMRAQAINQRLLNRPIYNTPHYCCICTHPPLIPMTLPCSHTFCFDCLLRHPMYGSGCPYCKAECDWDVHQLSIESILSPDIKASITKPRPQNYINQSGPSSSSSSSSSSSVISTPSFQSSKLPPQSPHSSNMQQVHAAAIKAAAAAAAAALSSNGSPLTEEEQQMHAYQVQQAVKEAMQSTLGVNFNSTVAGKVFSPIPAVPSPRAFHSGRSIRSNGGGSVISGISENSTNNAMIAGNTAAFFAKFFATSDYRPKRGQGVSCHQCKTTKNAHLLLFCSNKGDKKEGRRRCRKKYCENCLKRSYSATIANQLHLDANKWKCPSCLGLCICASCMRRGSDDEGEGQASEGESDEEEDGGIKKENGTTQNGQYSESPRVKPEPTSLLLHSSPSRSVPVPPSPSHTSPPVSCFSVSAPPPSLHPPPPSAASAPAAASTSSPIAMNVSPSTSSVEEISPPKVNQKWQEEKSSYKGAGSTVFAQTLTVPIPSSSLISPLSPLSSPTGEIIPPSNNLSIDTNTASLCIPTRSTAPYTDTNLCLNRKKRGLSSNASVASQESGVGRHFDFPVGNSRDGADPECAASNPKKAAITPNASAGSASQSRELSRPPRIAAVKDNPLLSAQAIAMQERMRIQQNAIQKGLLEEQELHRQEQKQQRQNFFEPLPPVKVEEKQFLYSKEQSTIQQTPQYGNEHPAAAAYREQFYSTASEDISQHSAPAALQTSNQGSTHFGYSSSMSHSMSQPQISLNNSTPEYSHQPSQTTVQPLPSPLPSIDNSLHSQYHQHASTSNSFSSSLSPPPTSSYSINRTPSTEPTYNSSLPSPQSQNHSPVPDLLPPSSHFQTFDSSNTPPSTGVSPYSQEFSSVSGESDSGRALTREEFSFLASPTPIMFNNSAVENKMDRAVTVNNKAYTDVLSQHSAQVYTPTIDNRFATLFN